MTISGIYKIINKINNKFYLGSSKNLHKRWLRHKNDLKNNKHHNQALQRAYNKYGLDNFEFIIIFKCDISILKIEEQKYLNQIQSLVKKRLCYNIGKESTGGDNITNNPNKINIIKNIKNGIQKLFNSLSDEEKKIRYSKPGNRNPNWKGGKTFCKCGNRISGKSITCSKCRNRNGDKNPFYNKKHSEETKQKISNKRFGKYDGQQNKPIIIDNIEYRSAGEASGFLNIPMTTIRWRIISKNPKFINYKYK